MLKWRLVSGKAAGAWMVDIIDFSQQFFTSVVTAPVPERRGGKFVFLESGEAGYLVFAPREMATYHASIVERFCALRGLSGQFNVKHDSFDIETPGWRIPGGAHWEYSRAEGWLHLFGKSMAYGPLDLSWVRNCLTAARAFDDATVLLESHDGV